MKTILIDNLLITEKFLYLRRGPEGRSASPSSAEKTKIATDVASTMTKLDLMLEKADEEISAADDKLNSKRYKVYAKFSRGHIYRKRYEYLKRKLSRLKTIKKRIEKINDKFAKLEAIKDKKYTEVSAKTLNELNKELDKAARIWGIDVRRMVINKLKKRVSTNMLEGSRNNLASLKDLYSMMKDGETVYYAGTMKVKKQGLKVTLTYKGKSMDFYVSAKGTNLDWVMHTADGKKIRKNPRKSHILEGLNKNPKGKKSLPDKDNLYYSTTSAAKAYKARIPKEKPVLAKEEKKVNKVKVIGKKKESLMGRNAKIEGIIDDVKNYSSLSNRSILAAWKIANDLFIKRKSSFVYPKTKPHKLVITRSKDWKLLRITVSYKKKHGAEMKTQAYFSIMKGGLQKFDENNPTSDAEFPEDPLNKREKIVAQPKKPGQKGPKPLDWDKVANEAQEKREKQKQLGKWGEEVAKNIKKVRHKLTHYNQVSKAFILSVSEAELKREFPGNPAHQQPTIRNQQRYLNRYTYELQQIENALKTGNVNTAKEINKLAKVYRLLPDKFKKEHFAYAEDVMPTVSKPPVKVAIFPSVINKEWETIGKEKPTMVVRKKPTKKAPKVAKKAKKIEKKTS